MALCSKADLTSFPIELADTCNTEITGFKDQTTACEKNIKDQTADLNVQTAERNEIDEYVLLRPQLFGTFFKPLHRPNASTALCLLRPPIWLCTVWRFSPTSF